jgi:hypothetical protein
MIMSKKLPDRCSLSLYIWIYIYQLSYVALCFVTLSLSLSLSLLYIITLGNKCVGGLNLPPCCHICLSYVMGFDIKIMHQSIRTTHSHTSYCHHCHYYSVDFVFFLNVTCYTNSLLSRFHANIADLLDIMCTLVATTKILGRLECIEDFHILLMFNVYQVLMHPTTSLISLDVDSIISMKCILEN